MNNYDSAKEMQAAATKIAPINNFHGNINNFNEENATIITDLFDFETLDYYARKNCELPISQEEKVKYETEYRGGLQGDYSSEMGSKVSNVVDCLNSFPLSKRAVIMMNNSWWNHQDTDEAKCCRELHFYLTEDEESKKLLLNCTGIFRAQAVDIMPKNFYFVYKITELIQKKLNNINSVKCEIGSYSHFVTILVPTRND